jgi:SET domain-containing protein
MPKPLTAIKNYLEKHLTVKKSKIPNSGKGVYTKIDIEKDEIVTEYTGEKVSHTIGTARFILNQSDSLIYLNKKYFVDSRTDENCLATFINDASGLNKINLKNNVLMIRVRGRIFVVAKRNIKKGEELLISYGTNYWKNSKFKKV